ncbi:sigma-70 family RNA polymerase sigma factor [Cohnella pontilimi]|uniref:Sigma-70 family RNA polymerase sigma factor n=2 Tax=Cohnella pontilimi TaxID=2564100 RepID=A0A4U0F857_9BACL|nr:sigma-70 family RNA polymerase sigma factor [Cohnella pontilimi]
MRSYGKDVWNYAFALSGTRDMADDIMQDVFFKALKHLDTFRGESSMKTWLLKITRNTALNHKTTWFIRKVVPIDKWLEHGNKSEFPSAETKALERIQLNEAWTHVMKLPVKFREVLILFAYHGMTQKEIAETIRIPEGTVKSRLHHARIRFAEHYQRGDD